MLSLSVPAQFTVKAMIETVQVLYALPERQIIVDVPFASGMTVAQAVEASGLQQKFPAIAAQSLVAGVWGKAVANAYRLAAGDRVEITRPLQADPREMRRDYLSQGQVMGGAKPERGVKKPAP